ncbi:UV-B-induced protein At3g17800, chloroplastic-like [Nymphaea colorata]|nr:UV-B-induced protein At3g17800, chloroplastic-like [Nymphaea colorata]XP_031493110.1 UV-B-induced protein At3g17800, chloroplastic-like [Nymphaea colorata]
MDAIAVLGGQGVFVSGASVARKCELLTKTSGFGAKSAVLSAKFGVANGFLKDCPSTSVLGNSRRRSAYRGRRSMGARASMDSSETSAPIAPLQLESPIGQFLAQILRSHPHLLPSAVDQQLEVLQTDRDAAAQKEEPSTTGTDLILYRRIAEVKANERKKALEEILYALVVQKFMDADVPLISSISSSSSDPTAKVDTWPPQDQKLQKVHSPEAYEMIKNHLALILGNRLQDSSSIAQISKLRVGQVYMASIMYGYFLRRVDQRFQLEKTMKTLPADLSEGSNSLHQEMMDESKPNGWTQSQDGWSPLSAGPSMAESGTQAADAGFSPNGFGYGMKPYRLRSYVMSFDAETLQRYASIRSKEAVSIVEKHTEALFGRQEFSLDPSKEEAIRISFAGLSSLVLEAVTFGSFLWDMESYVDSRYHFVTN